MRWAAGRAGATAFEVVRWIGVVYLAFMGVSLIRGGSLRLDDVESVDQPLTTVVRRAVLLGFAARLAITDR